MSSPQKLQDDKTPKWLENIQNNSWEPEILISGLSIAFFFILPKYIYNFTAMLIQDFGANVVLTSVQHGLMIFIITSLQVLFLGHLTLRGFWAGLVGLSYVFPNGVRKEGLNKDLKACNFKKPIDLVIEVERICSLIFSFAFMIILYLITIMAIYAVLIVLFMLLHAFDLNSGETRIIQVALLIFVSGSFLVYQKIKNKAFKNHISKSMTSNLIYTFSTNVSKKTMVLFLLGYTIITIPLAYSKISKFSFDVKDKQKVKKSEILFVDENNYINTKDNELRIQRIAIDSFLIEKDYLELYISTYKSDKILIKDIKGNYDKFKEIMPGIELDKLDFTGLYKIYIDDKEILVKDWIIIKDNKLSQKFLTSYIPTDSLSNEIHTLKVDRVKWRIKEKDFVLNENWASLPFKVKH